LHHAAMARGKVAQDVVAHVAAAVHDDVGGVHVDADARRHIRAPRRVRAAAARACNVNEMDTPRVIFAPARSFGGCKSASTGPPPSMGARCNSIETPSRHRATVAWCRVDRGCQVWKLS